MLSHAREKSTFLRRLEAEDIEAIIEHLNVLEFDEGEQIMVKGEAATWVGILLSGEVAALVNGEVVATMGVGKIVGEVAFFSAGNRMADVRGSRKGFIAFMMINHLEDLLRNNVQAGLKLISALGASAVYQLSHNQQAHRPLDWGVGALERPKAEKELASWQAQHFALDELSPFDNFSDAEAAELVTSMRARCAGLPRSRDWWAAAPRCAQSTCLAAKRAVSS